MPTKLLVWNIQNFTINKINYWDSNIGLNSRTVTNLPQLKLHYILNNVTLTDPDIFVVIEVISGKGSKGSLVSGKGAQGLLFLLKCLRALNNQWCLVPSLKLVDKVNVTEIIQDRGDDEEESLKQLINEGQYTEGIGVFYRQDRLTFQGPYVWPNTPNNSDKRAVPASGATPGPYPDEWQNCLPNGNYFAGQFEFFYPNKSPIEFPATTSRVPFLTRFVEINDPKRLITLAAVHLPPNTTGASPALSRLAGCFLDNGITDNEVQIIAGDYNLNFGEYYNTDRTHLQGLYGFEPAFVYGDSPTMLTRIKTATPIAYQPSLILDNIAVKFGMQANKSNNKKAIINRVFDKDIPTLMEISLDKILQLPHDKQDETFRLPLNYGRLGPVPGTSDHLAVFVQF